MKKLILLVLLASVFVYFSPNASAAPKRHRASSHSHAVHHKHHRHHKRHH